MKTSLYKFYNYTNYSIYRRVQQLKHRSGRFLSSVHVVFWCKNGLSRKLIADYCSIAITHRITYLHTLTLKIWYCFDLHISISTKMKSFICQALAVATIIGVVHSACNYGTSSFPREPSAPVFKFSYSGLTGSLNCVEQWILSLAL